MFLVFYCSKQNVFVQNTILKTMYIFVVRLGRWIMIRLNTYRGERVYILTDSIALLEYANVIGQIKCNGNNKLNALPGIYIYIYIFGFDLGVFLCTKYIPTER